MSGFHLDGLMLVKTTTRQKWSWYQEKNPKTQVSRCQTSWRFVMMTTWKEAVRCPSQSTDQHTECEMVPLEIIAVHIAIKKWL